MYVCKCNGYRRGEQERGAPADHKTSLKLREAILFLKVCVNYH